jgi:hypothetical protein
VKGLAVVSLLIQVFLMATMLYSVFTNNLALLVFICTLFLASVIEGGDK